MRLNQTAYELLIPAWPLRRGQTRWLHLVRKLLRIEAYGFLKQKRVGDYKLRLDPGDANDLHYYFNKVGEGYSFLIERLLRTGDCVVDVGSNVGYFSAVCAQRVGRGGVVYALEASPSMAERLRHSVAEIPGGPIRCYHTAVWSSSGVISFNVASNSGWSSLRQNATFEAQWTVEVPATTLDDFADREGIQQIRMLKLDIEGAETDALLGASGLLGHATVDYILFEVEPHRLRAFGHTGQELAGLMDRYGYRPVCVIEGDTVCPVQADRRIPGASNCDYLYTREGLHQSSIASLFGKRQ